MLQNGPPVGLRLTSRQNRDLITVGNQFLRQCLSQKAGPSGDDDGRTHTVTSFCDNFHISRVILPKHPAYVEGNFAILSNLLIRHVPWSFGAEFGLAL